jgi:hypothetical protein
MALFSVTASIQKHNAFDATEARQLVAKLVLNGIYSPFMI